MKRVSALGVAAAAVMASGCIIIDADEVSYRGDPPNRPARCEVAAFQSLVGQRDDEIDRDRLPQSFRIICHDCQATMDYNPNRLNIQLDPQNRVASVSCG
jgi:hypothetical protein